MRFEASLKDLQQAIKTLEKNVSKSRAKKSTVMTNQIDMFADPKSPANDLDIEMLKKQLDAAIDSVESLVKQAG